MNVGRVPVVQEAWKNGHPLSIHGVVYDLKDGILKDLGVTLSAIDHLPSEFQIIKWAKKDDSFDLQTINSSLKFNLYFQ